MQICLSSLFFNSMIPLMSLCSGPWPVAISHGQLWHHLGWSVVGGHCVLLTYTHNGVTLHILRAHLSEHCELYGSFHGRRGPVVEKHHRAFDVTGSQPLPGCTASVCVIPLSEMFTDVSVLEGRGHEGLDQSTEGNFQSRKRASLQLRCIVWLRSCTVWELLKKPGTGLIP